MPKFSSVTPLRVIDHDVAGPAGPDDMFKLSAPLTTMLTAEIDGAHRYLKVAIQELLIAALGRTIARTFGEGDACVDVYGHNCPISLTCVTTRPADATAVLGTVHRMLTAPAPPVFGAALPPPDVFFSYLDTAPAPSLVDLMPVDSSSGGGYPLALRAYRSDDALKMDWWYDARRLDRATVEELTEQFPLAVIELTSEADPPSEKNTQLAMVRSRGA
jgi:hypothetical protein